MLVSVDLPIPGEPPRSTTEPGTSPPPSTRSSSPMPVVRRGDGRALTSRRATGRAAAPRRAPATPALGPAGTRSSTSVFHSEQDGQRPCHRGVVAPHAEQTWTEADRAMILVERRARGGGSLPPSGD